MSKTDCRPFSRRQEPHPLSHWKDSGSVSNTKMHKYFLQYYFQVMRVNVFQSSDTKNGLNLEDSWAVSTDWKINTSTSRLWWTASGMPVKNGDLPKPLTIWKQNFSKRCKQTHLLNVFI